MSQTPPSRPRSNVYAMPNPEGSSTGSNIKAIIITAALTALVGVATVGAATGIWRAATRRASRILKRQEAEQLVAAASTPAAGPYLQNGYLVWPQAVPQPNSRNAMPDALRDVPTLVQPPAPIVPPSVAPTPIVVAPSPEIVAELRRMGTSFDRRLGGIERRLDEFGEEPEGDDDDEYEEDDEPEPPPAAKKGKRRR